MKILIKGYYGFGNLGDDILMIVSFNLIKSIYPDSAIYIYSNAENPNYIYQYLGEVDGIINYSANMNYDLIFHGGGGVHYDFQKGGIRFYLINSIIKQIGYKNYSKIFLYFKKNRKKPLIKGDTRIGMGIGVGTFTKSSKKFYNNIIELSSYDMLHVRDKGSVDNLLALKVDLNTHLSTDLAFHTEPWRKLDLNNKIKRGKNVGIVLRDWPNNIKRHFESVEKLANILKIDGYSITFYSFDVNTDQQFITYFSKDFQVNQWLPNEMELDDYLQKLLNEDLLITSRAHGAIIGACLEIPSICIEIEPKLEMVSKMLINSSSLIPFYFDINDTINLVKSKLESSVEDSKLVKEDYLCNRDNINGAINNVRNFLKKKIKTS